MKTQRTLTNFLENLLKIYWRHCIILCIIIYLLSFPKIDLRFKSVDLDIIENFVMLLYLMSFQFYSNIVYNSYFLHWDRLFVTYSLAIYSF